MQDKDFPFIEFNSEDTQLVTAGRCTRCPICGKVICIPDINAWVYKMVNKQGRQRLTCSWTCHRKAEALQQTTNRRNDIIDRYLDLDRRGL